MKAKEILICQTDKTGRFCILTAEQYLEAGKIHTQKDLEVEIEDAEEIQRILNGNMRWLAKAVNLSIDWDQEERALKNLLNHGLAVCPMTLLIKDHKVWDITKDAPPSRSVMGGNKGGNTNISEIISIVLEPIANSQPGSLEENATDGFLANVTKLNKRLASQELVRKGTQSCTFSHSYSRLIPPPVPR